MRSPDPEWKVMPIASGAGKRRCRMHGGAAESGAPIGNPNALRHGRYITHAIARRRQLSELIRTARVTLADIEDRR